MAPLFFSKPCPFFKAYYFSFSYLDRVLFKRECISETIVSGDRIFALSPKPIIQERKWGLCATLI